MAEKVNGTSTAAQCLSADIQYFVCYACSPGAFTDPDPRPSLVDDIVRLINIQVTGIVTDTSQKNFEVLFNAIGLRATPVIFNNPKPVLDLAAHTARLSGEGFEWKFAVERTNQFFNFTRRGTPGPTGLLVDELDGVILPSGVRLTTVQNSASGWAQNVEFEILESI